MSRSIRRQITVLQKEYIWVLNGNTIDSDKECHIKIHCNQLTKSILYLDPYNWHFEIRPKTIEKAILFAIKNGWNPLQKGKEMYLSMKNEGRIVSIARRNKVRSFGSKQFHRTKNINKPQNT